MTLVELIVVISIIGILSSVILPRLNIARDKAQVAKAQVELGSIKIAIDVLHDDVALYPNADISQCRTVGLPDPNEINLSDNNAGILANGLSWADWNGPYAPDVIDPWGNSYFLDEDYDCLAATEGCMGLTDTTSVLVSCGPNEAATGGNGSCDYDADNIVVRLCD